MMRGIGKRVAIIFGVVFAGSALMGVKAGPVSTKGARAQGTLSENDSDALRQAFADLQTISNKQGLAKWIEEHVCLPAVFARAVGKEAFSSDERLQLLAWWPCFIANNVYTLLMSKVKGGTIEITDCFESGRGPIYTVSCVFKAGQGEAVRAGLIIDKDLRLRDITADGVSIVGLLRGAISGIVDQAGSRVPRAKAIYKGIEQDVMGAQKTGGARRGKHAKCAKSH